jgi:hypothetical protein
LASSIPERRRGAIVALLVLALGAPGVHAQDPGAPILEARRVAGRVLTPADTGMRAIAGAWVTLHRIGFDSAGPVDSVRSGAQGQYAMTWRAPVDDSAAYVTSSTYAGIAHFSATFTEPVVTGDPAEIVVFDTTSTDVDLHVRGRHFVVFAAAPGERRRVLEVFELENHGVKTALPRGGQPLWRTALPAGAVNVTVDRESLPADAVRVQGRDVRFFAPVTPGMRQLAIRYELPASSFPFSLRLPESVGFLEVLVEEPLARVSAPGLEEVERAESEGHQLRRFLARNVGPNVVVRIELPTAARARRSSGVAFIVVGAAITLLLALLFSLRRTPARALTGTGPVLVERSGAG